MESTNKVVLITGAAKRIGAALSRHLHRAGFNIAIHYACSREEAELLEAELNDLRKESAVAIPANLQNLNELAVLAERAMNRWGRLDAVINNASRFYPTEVSAVTPNVWGDLLDSNVRAPFFLSQAIAPALAKQKGCIINIVDIYSERPLNGYPVYNITKAAIAMLTKTLAVELGPEIRVNGISPGAILWPENAAELTTSDQQKIISKTALKRSGSPEDICTAALYLIENAPYVTGQIIAVDGGRTLNQ